MPSEVRFAEIVKLLKQHGYFLDRVSGSHHIFEKPRENPIIVPVHHGKVKPIYVRKIQKLIEAS